MGDLWALIYMRYWADKGLNERILEALRHPQVRHDDRWSQRLNILPDSMIFHDLPYPSISFHVLPVYSYNSSVGSTAFQSVLWPIPTRTFAFVNRDFKWLNVLRLCHSWVSCGEEHYHRKVWSTLSFKLLLPDTEDGAQSRLLGFLSDRKSVV